MQIDLSKRTALVTGATGDLGRVMVRTLAQCGADVAIHYHGNQSKADELCAEVEAIGRRACAVQADVTDAASVKTMQRFVVDTLGAPEIIVNNAVIQYTWKRAMEQDPEDYESQFRSCVMHNVYMAKTFVPAMMAKGWGRVIGINTECSIQCWPSQSAYVSGKHGMNGFLQTLAKEVGKEGVTVNQIAPGYMFSDRDRQKQAQGGEDQRTAPPYATMLPLKHRGEDQDIANLVVFLASDLAKFITGGFIPVHGGGPTIPHWMEETEDTNT